MAGELDAEVLKSVGHRLKRAFETDASKLPERIAQELDKLRCAEAQRNADLRNAKGSQGREGQESPLDVRAHPGEQTV